MRITSCLLSTLIAASLLGGQEQIPDSCVPKRTDYGTAFVTSAFQYYREAYKQRVHYGRDTRKFTEGSTESLLQYGDAISTAVLKICPLDELVKPHSAGTYLTLVRISFTDKGKVLEKSDQEPRVTSLVLDYLEQKESADAALEKRIDYMKHCTKDFTCSSRGDFDSDKSQSVVGPD
jgi:hypothetical protein